MKWNLKNVLWRLVCLISYLLALWICVDNIQAITDRAKGHYPTIYRGASLPQGEAIVYFGLLTFVFIVLFILSLKNLVKKMELRAGIYAIVLILLFVISNFVDTLFNLNYG
jgi:hypothetical protein